MSSRYRIKTFNAASGGVRSWVETLQAASAAAALPLQPGETVVSVRWAGWAGWSWRAGTRAKLDVALVCDELARLLRAGLTLPEAVRNQQERVEGPARAVYQSVSMELDSGLRLSDALEAVGGFPAVLIAAVRASERSGRIVDALEEYARYDRSLQALRRKLVSAAVYPALVLGLGAFISLFLLGYVVPRFSLIFDGTAAKPSGASSVLMSLGMLINHHAVAVGACALAAALVIVWASRHPAAKSRALNLLAALGPIAQWLVKLQMARITHAMSMLLGNGFMVPASMRLAASLAMQSDLGSRMGEALRAVESGVAVSDAWSSAGLADGYAVRILRAGERTGRLAQSFETLAETYRIDVETRLERAARVAEPLLLLFVAVFVGVIVLLMYLPIFDLAGAVQ